MKHNITSANKGSKSCSYCPVIEERQLQRTNVKCERHSYYTDKYKQLLVHYVQDDIFQWQ